MTLGRDEPPKIRRRTDGFEMRKSRSDTQDGIKFFLRVVVVPVDGFVTNLLGDWSAPVKLDTQRVVTGCTPEVSDSPAGNGDARCCSPPSRSRSGRARQQHLVSG